jgi:TFIIF-interacting CTD phosphatase-like protein
MGYDVYKRPHLDHFLKFLFNNHNVGFFTSAEKDYANGILDNILTKKQKEETLFIHDRKFCDIIVEDIYSIYNHGGANFKVYKKLKKVFRRSGINKNRTIAIDDKPYSFRDSYSNCIPVKPFLPLRKDTVEDTELLALVDYIEQF